MAMPRTKVFAGKRYERVGSYPTEREANYAARKHRQRGNPARVSRYIAPNKAVFYLLFVRR